MAREYSIWNAVVAALNFWTADLEAHTLGSTTEEVYRAFFYAPSAHTLCQMPDEILFGHFVTMLNATFEQKLALEDEGYESGSENFNIPTLLRITSKIHHTPNIENASFDPVSVTPCSTRQSHLRPVCRRSQEQYHTPDARSSPSNHTLATYEHLEEEEAAEEEDFQTIPLMMNIGLLKRFLTDHYAYMNIPYHMEYACTHVHMWITRLHPTLRPWI